MQISVTSPHELGPDEIAVWRSMQHKTDSLASPFLSPEFALAVGAFRPNTRVAVLSDGPELVGFFPFERRRLGVGVPIGAGLNNRQGLIHAPAVEWDPRALLRACRVSVWQFDNLVAGQRPFEPYAVTMTPSPVIDLASGFDAYQQKLRIASPRFCKDLARKARKLEQEAGELRLVVDSRDSEALRVLIDWKSDQYRRNGMVDIFDRPWVAALVDRLFSTRSDHLASLLSVLYAGETPVAAQLGLRSGRVLAGWFCAYDPRFGRRSPGLLEHVRTVEEAAAIGVHLIDLGSGPERYKQKLKNHDLLISAGAVARGPVLAHAHRVHGAATDVARRHIKRHPTLFRAADKLLRHYGRIV
ncbi:MAG: GNAT family N-acetyltransferase [Streptosporangiaceae bacterium]